MHFLMASTLRVLNPLPEKGAQKQQILQRKENGIQAGKSPEEKETTSPTVVSAEPTWGERNRTVQHAEFSKGGNLWMCACIGFTLVGLMMGIVAVVLFM